MPPFCLALGFRVIYSWPNYGRSPTSTALAPPGAGWGTTVTKASTRGKGAGSGRRVVVASSAGGRERSKRSRSFKAGTRFDGQSWRLLRQ